jgi:serine/threonine protein kinase
MSFSHDNPNLQKLSKKIAEGGKDFIVVLGAGASRQAGLPNWRELRDSLLECVEQRFLEMGKSGIKNFLETTRDLPDYWDAFEEIQKELGLSEYTKAITSRLDTSVKQTPKLYPELWKLNIAGIVTFNLDKFSLDSYSNQFGKAVDYATGIEPHKYSSFLSNHEGFVFHPHGILTDPSSWVMTRSEKNRLYQEDSFKKILCNLFNAKNLIFIGFNPGENAFLDLLGHISIYQGKLSGDNFCIIPSVSEPTRRKYEEVGLSIISYAPDDSEMHTEVLDIIKWLTKNKASFDVDYASVSSDKAQFEETQLEELLKQDYTLEDLRKTLNGIISKIIPAEESPTADEIEKLKSFYKKHGRLLHDAWYINPDADGDDDGSQLWGYRLTGKIGKGSFGRVLEAYDSQGKKLAIKVLLEEVRDNQDYMNCFRRGSRAMQIMKKHHVNGMVEIKEAYEVPACIVMDYIEGYTLRQAVDNRCFATLQQRLIVIEKIAEIIHTAHQLEESVLHRDIKPENIILENCYSSDFDDDLEVKVLDFDLAWHRGATENTVLATGSQGFMAPEQAITGKHDRTRSKAVDVYSIGMLLYYMLLDENPLPNAHKFKKFRENIVEGLERKHNFSWHVCPAFLADTIILATKHAQTDRISLSTFIERLRTVSSMEIEDSLANSHPMLLQELSSLIDPISEVQLIDEFGRNIRAVNHVMGKSIEFSTSSAGSEIILNISLRTMKNSADNRNRNVKYIRPALDKATSKANRQLFQVEVDKIIDPGVMSIILHCKLPQSISKAWLKNAANNIKDIRTEMQFT